MGCSYRLCSMKWHHCQYNIRYEYRQFIKTRIVHRQGRANGMGFTLSLLLEPLLKPEQINYLFAYE